MLKFKQQIAGKFKVKVKHQDGSESTCVGENLITNKGMTVSLGNSYLHVGTSSTEPLPTNTQLGQYLAGSAVSGGVTTFSVVDGILLSESTFNFKFTVGEVVGNITELGMAVNASQVNQNLLTHALIRDSQGAPSSITVVAFDELTVEYTLYLEMDLAPQTGFITLTDNGEVSNVGYTYYAVLSTGDNNFSSPTPISTYFQPLPGIYRLVPCSTLGYIRDESTYHVSGTGVASTNNGAKTASATLLTTNGTCTWVGTFSWGTGSDDTWEGFATPGAYNSIDPAYIGGCMIKFDTPITKLGTEELTMVIEVETTQRAKT